ncbi:MFS transporter [Pseudonocardia asaccharolytica]|uniref:MFS transporter n=1 Tax=Pseudonocardia asaccharolytica TaxID=54010 RepID=UPI00040B0CCB|nr:MFS transporter [Pseudonocardia asaccharolytica]
MSHERTAPPRPRASSALLVVAILLFALNLRGPLVAVSPVLDVIAHDLGIGAATAGLLTSLPVLCFGLASPLAAWLLARSGLERGVLIALAGILAGTILRSLDGLPAALAGTVAIGLAITVGNVAVPVVIGRDLARRANSVLGAYTAALNVGSMLMLSLTVPIAMLTGWRVALASWSGLVVVAALVWWRATRGCAEGTAAAAASQDSEPDRAPVWWRRPVVWGLTVAFAGQAFAYYAVTAWLPLLLRDERGLDERAAGAGSSIFQILALVGAFGVPVLLHRWPGGRRVVALVCVAWLALVVGLLVAPAGWPVWCALGGAAQGGGITAIFALIVRHAHSVAENRRMSAMVQGGGYVVAAAGPTVVGSLREATGGWTVPLLVVLGAIAVLAVAGTLAARTPQPS